MAREPINVEEELLAQQEEEEEQRRLAFEEQQQLERMQAMQQAEEEARQNSPVQQAKNLATDYAKGVAKTAAKDAAVSAATAAGSAIVSTAPVWAPILGIIVLLLGMGMFVLITLVAKCNETSLSGSMTRGLSSLAGFLPGVGEDVCANLAIGTGGRSGGAGGGDVVPINIVLTSAYRPGAVVDNDPTRPSAHGRGEAFDIALEPAVPFRPTDPAQAARVSSLVSLARGMGFTNPTGDVVDEYNNPSPGTQGPHVHVEFNVGNCGSSPATNPPNDLVAIPSNIPRRNVSDARVRACMLPSLMQLFTQAGVIDD